jgi:hypothetical protein
MQFQVGPEVTEQLSARQETLEMVVGDYRKLIQVVTIHGFERFRQGRIRLHGVQIFERKHHIVKRQVRPSGTLDSFDLVSRYQSGEFPFGENDKTPPPCGQHLVLDEIL